MDIIGRVRKYGEVPSQMAAMQAAMYSLSAQVRSAEESLRKEISNPVKISPDSSPSHANESPLGRGWLVTVLLILTCLGVIVAYSGYQISSAQGYVATDQHNDQEATDFLVVSVQQGLIGNYQRSDYFYNGAIKVLRLNGPLIDHYENVQADYSLPLVISTALLGALLGWTLTEMLRVRRRQTPHGGRIGRLTGHVRS